MLGNRVLNTAISHVVRQRLFIAEASPIDKFVSAPVERVSAKTNLTQESVSAFPSASATIVTTPDSGCGTAEDDSCVVASNSEDCQTPVFIPKLDLREALEDENPVNDIAEIVPRLDLSEISPQDDDCRRKNLHSKQSSTPSKSHRKRSSKSPQVSLLM